MFSNALPMLISSVFSFPLVILIRIHQAFLHRISVFWLGLLQKDCLSHILFRYERFWVLICIFNRDCWERASILFFLWLNFDVFQLVSSLDSLLYILFLCKVTLAKVTTKPSSTLLLVKSWLSSSRMTQTSVVSIYN